MTAIWKVGAILLLLVTAFAGLSAQPAAISIPVANGDFEADRPGDPPAGWAGTPAQAASGSGSGEMAYRAVVDSDNPRSGKASVRLEALSERPPPDAFGVLTRTVDAAPYRGKRVRLTAAVRVRQHAGTKAGLWMRVDRPGRRMGFFDNMDDRPIRDAGWADHVVEGDVASDAVSIFFGLLLSGPGAAWMDDVRLDVVGPARGPGNAQAGPQRPRVAPGPGDAAPKAPSARGLENLHAFARLYGYVRWFHPSDEVAAADWDRLAIAGVERVERASNPTELAEALREVFEPVAPTLLVYAGDFPRFRPVMAPAGLKLLRWKHRGIGEDPGGIYGSVREEEGIGAFGAARKAVKLPGGVAALIPLGLLRGADGKTSPAATRPALVSAKPAGFVPSGFDRSSRLAAAITGWNLLQHFYPYHDVVGVNWTVELDKALKAAATDRDDLAFHRTLRLMVAAIDDGHGGVGYAGPPTGILPIAWDWAETRLVVTAAAPGIGVSRGDVVTHFDGLPAPQAIARLEAVNSGSPQFVRARAVREMLLGKPGAEAVLRIAGQSGASRTVRLAYRDTEPGSEVREAKPEPIAQIAPGIFYVDLDRADEQVMRSRELDLAAARGLIFDLRGYPRSSPWFLSRFSDKPVRSAAFDVPVYVRPDREGVTYQEGGWEVQPTAPRFPANVVFITNGKAVSYAESVLGLVRANRLAEIVGEPTAGANGNVTFFRLPGGYRMSWTAMRVVNRDGSQHHLIGVRPTVPVSRTLAGIRAGRDEQLERALAIVKAKAAN